MGYEIKLLIGKTGFGSPEILKSNIPYSDGSGFHDAKDEHGNRIPTGNTAHYFQVFAELDLCKIGGGPTNDLIGETIAAAKETKDVYYFYGTTDGNKEVKYDKYGDKLAPVPIKKVLKALKKETEHYRRYQWAIALLESMAEDPEKLEVMFFGH